MEEVKNGDGVRKFERIVDAEGDTAAGESMFRTGAAGDIMIDVTGEADAVVITR